MRGPQFRPVSFHPNRHGLVMPARVDPTGAHGPTKTQAAGRDYRRSSRGYYVPAEVERSVEQRIVEAGVLLPAYGGVTGWAALRWGGGYWFSGLTPDGTDPLPVCLAGEGVRRRPGVDISEEGLDPATLTAVDGLRVTTMTRSVMFEMRYAVGIREAVVAMEMAAYSDLVSLAEARSYAEELYAWTGIPQAREGLALADENSWSPWETRMRLVWVLDAGLPAPLCNAPIFDRRGNHVGTPDLFDPEAGMVGEYDGSLHLVGAQRARDVRREEAFRRLGLEHLRCLNTDVADREATVRRMHDVRRRARWLPESRRPWTLEPPSWWVDTHTVEQRRALDQDQRERFLRLRLRVG